MPTKVAIVTPASLRGSSGSSLRPLYQALGLWAIGFEDFIVFSPEPDPDRPFPQERIRVYGPAQFIGPRKFGCPLVHAHQNAGLFLDGRPWVDWHGYAPLESLENWREHRGSLRALAHCALSAWAAPRLLRRAGRVLCASASIAANLRRRRNPLPPVTMLPNVLDPGKFPPTPCRDPVVGVIGGFTSRWGRPALAMTLRVAERCPTLTFRLVGAVTDEQRTQAAARPNIEILGHVDELSYSLFLQRVSIALMPYASWCVGGGCRLKLLQSAASALAVAATPAGLEGFEAKDAVLEGRDPDELAEILNTTLADPAERQRRGLALRQYVAQAHDFKQEAQKLAELYESVSNEQ